MKLFFVQTSKCKREWACERVSQSRFTFHVSRFTIGLFVMLIWAVFAGAAQTTDSGGSQPPKYKVIEVNNGGSITGQVKFIGDAPKPEVIKTNKDQGVCGTKQMSEAFIVSPQTKGIKNAVIYLVNVKMGVKLEYVTHDKRVITPESQVTLSQKGCVYVPHVQAAFLGSKLNVINGDTVLHNVHAYEKGRRAYFQWHPQSTLFNFAQPTGGQEVPVNLEVEGIIGVKCDVHNWMEAYVYVATHPYFDVTDENGQYQLTNIPPGQYKLEMWHEKIGTLKKSEIVVTAGGETKVDFPIKPVAAQ